MKTFSLKRASALGLIIALLLVAVVIAGCFSTAPRSSTTTTAAATGSGTLNLSDIGPFTLDPALAAEAGSGLYILQIFSGLVRLDQNMQVVPDIAASWDKSTDGKTYTFHLRPDARFHDGKQVTAADFKYSWERALTPNLQSPTAGVYLDDIAGAVEMLTSKATQLSGVTAVDSQTLKVSITSPVAYFLEKMAFPTSFVVDKANVQKGSNWFANPNGSGPFKLAQWQPGQSVVLQRNPLYYGEKAKLDKVAFQLFSGNSMNLYQQGQVDVTEVGAPYMGLVTDPTNPVSKELMVSPELSLYYYGFDTSKPPFDDAGVRRAFSYAVDKTKLIALANYNVVPPAYGILPPGMPGYNDKLQGLTYDPQKARAALAASKYPDLSKVGPIVITTQGWGNAISGTMGGAIADWKRNLGVDVSVRQLEPQDFLYFLNREKDNMFDQGWIADYPDPQDFLEVLFRTGGYYNSGKYSNPQLDSLLAQAAVAQDTAARLKMYQDAEQMVVQDAAVLPMSYGRSYILVKPYVKNYTVNILGFPLLNMVSIQK